MAAPRLQHLSIWLSLLSVALVFWLIVSCVALLIEVAGVLFGAILLSLAITPMADRLAQWHLPRGLTVIGIYLIGGMLTFSLAELLAPVVHADMRLLRERGPQLAQQGFAWLTALPSVGGIAATIHPTTAANLDQQLGSIADPVLRMLSGTGGFLIDLLIVGVLTYLFVTELCIGQPLAGQLGACATPGTISECDHTATLPVNPLDLGASAHCMLLCHCLWCRTSGAWRSLCHHDWYCRWTARSCSLPRRCACCCLSSDQRLTD